MFVGCGGRSIGSLLLGVSTMEVGAGEVLQKTKLGYRISAHLYCHLLCDFSWEDIKYLFTPDNHYWQSEGMSHPESG